MLKRFEDSKLVILLTARVHPGETPASYGIKGVIDFLLEENNPQARLLRNMFVFKIIPMINPDGVIRGHFRTDGFGRNLNRYYGDPHPIEQPSVFAICQLINYFQNDKRIFFFCDFHAHSSYKNHFFYGNSLGFILQVEARAFAKIMEINNLSFGYNCCVFSKNQMNSKERNPLEKIQRTKDNCSRVATYKYAHLIHSFTLELGYHNSFFKDKQIPSIVYSTQCFEKIGSDLVVSLLDLFDKNPLSKIKEAGYDNLGAIRKEIADQIKPQFRKIEMHINQKISKVNEMIEEKYYGTVI